MHALLCMYGYEEKGREVGEKEDERNGTEIQCVPMNLNGRARRARCIGLTSFLFFLSLLLPLLVNVY